MVFRANTCFIRVGSDSVFKVVPGIQVSHISKSSNPIYPVPRSTAYTSLGHSRRRGFYTYKCSNREAVARRARDPLSERGKVSVIQQLARPREGARTVRGRGTNTRKSTCTPSQLISSSSKPPTRTKPNRPTTPNPQYTNHSPRPCAPSGRICRQLW